MWQFHPLCSASRDNHKMCFFFSCPIRSTTDLSPFCSTISSHRHVNRQLHLGSVDNVIFQDLIFVHLFLHKCLEVLHFPILRANQIIWALHLQMCIFFCHRAFHITPHKLSLFKFAVVQQQPFYWIQQKRNRCWYINWTLIALFCDSLEYLNQLSLYLYRCLRVQPTWEVMKEPCF